MSDSDPISLFQDDEPELTQSSNDEPAESEGETDLESQAAEGAEPEEADVEEDSQLEESDDTEGGTGDDEEAESTEDDSTELYLDLDGVEVSLNDVRTWKKADMSEKKFTQLRQDDAKREKRNEANETRINEQSLGVQAVVQETTAFLEELKRDGYLDDGAYTNLIAKSQTLRDGVLASEGKSRQDNVVTENQLWFKRNKQWLDDDNNFTDQYKQDIARIETYLAKEGYSPAQMSTIVDHRLKIAIHKAAKYDDYLSTRKKKVVEVRKQVKKAKVQSKPRVKPKAQPAQSAEESVFGSID